MLTLQMLKDMPSGTIFAHGITTDDSVGINMTNSGNKLKWLAKRGEGYHDWSIYCHWAAMSESFIETNGDKVCSMENIKKLVPCDDEAYKIYRR